MKIYMPDGNTIQFEITEIENINVTKTFLPSTMTLYQSNIILNKTFHTSTIDSINFMDNQTMKIFQGDKISLYVISDIDSIIFKSNECFEIQIGNQIWMCRNLNVDHYLNGDSIPEVRDSATWANLTTGAWCYYDNDSANGSKYGKLYNWFALKDPRGLAPKGWRIPIDQLWTPLVNFVKSDGGKLKEAGLLYWEAPNVDATNTSGFTALPGGQRNAVGVFESIGSAGIWWSSTDEFTYFARFLCLFSGKSEIYRNTYRKECGFSVRCIKD